MKKWLALLLLFAVPASAQIMGARNRKVFASAIAIAPDNASSEQTVSTSATLTYSYTTGSITNGMLFVGVWNPGTVTAPSSVTYNGSAMTLAKSTTWFFGGGSVLLYVMIAPPSGAHNVVVTYGTSQSNIKSSAASYSGVNQSVTPDASTSASGGSTSVTQTLTTVANNCWTFAYVGTGNSTVVSAGTGSTQRTTGSSQTGIFDSNGPKTPAGSTSQQDNITPTSQYGAVMVSYTHA